MAPISPGTSPLKPSARPQEFGMDIRPGFTTVQSDNRISDKVRREVAPISPATSKLRPAELSRDLSNSDVRPGFTAVRGEDARISGKTSRGITTAAVLPLDLLAAPPFHNDDTEEPIRPAALDVRGQNMSESLQKRAARSSSPGIPSFDAVNSSSFSSVPGVMNVQGQDPRISRKMQSRSITPPPASLKVDDTEPSEQPATKPGAVSAFADSRVARKIGAASMASASNSASSFGSYEVTPGEPGYIAPGTVSPMADDSRASRKLRSSLGSPGVFATTNDSQVRRKVSRNPGTVSGSQAKMHPETFDDEPDGLPVPGSAVASLNDSRVSRKIAQANNGVGAVSAADDTAVSKKVGRSRGAVLGLSAATAAAATIGAVRTFGDDEAAQKKSFVRDDLFANDDGHEIDAYDYLRQQVRATQEAQQKKTGKKKMDKGMDDSDGLHKDGVSAVPKAPGAFSVKGGRGWFTGGYRQRAARGMVRHQNHLTLDAEVTAMIQDDFDEDETWWDRADKPTLIVGACVLVFAIIVITVPLALVATKKDPPTPAPTSARFFELDEFQVSLSSVSDPALFENPQSPQSRALNWIVFDDELQLSSTDEAIIQRYICMVVYFGNGGEGWDFPQPAVEWGTGVHECEWDYITCEVNKTVGKLNLLDLGMTGTLEAEMVNLSQLTSLDLGRNKLNEVNFPSLLLQMTNLRFLYLDALDLKGTLPSEIAKLSKLEQLFLGSNSFSGALPSELQSLSSMESFQANMNNFEGYIFNIVSGWPLLKNLDVGNNDFDGSIPTKLPSSLQTLRLDRNSIGGTLPTELGTLTNLISVILTQNFRLGGWLPSELGKCSSLETLHVDSNTFIGSLPSEFGNLPRIQELRLGQNEFTGMIPSELGRCTTMTSLDFNNNNFNSAVPTELGMITGLSMLWLQFSDVSGSMPTEICSLRQEKLVDLQADCKFSGAQLECDEPQCCTLCH